MDAPRLVVQLVNPESVAPRDRRQLATRTVTPSLLAILVEQTEVEDTILTRVSPAQRGTARPRRGVRRGHARRG